MKLELNKQPDGFQEMWPGSSESFPWHELLAAIPSPIFLVTTYKSNGKANACLQSWSTFFGDASEFLCLMGSVNTAGHLYKTLTQTKQCVLNFPDAEIYDKCTATIKNNAYDDDEINSSGLTIEEARTVGAPRVKECFLNLECEYLWEHKSFKESKNVTVALRVKHVAVNPEHLDENKKGRYGLSGYIYNIHQPYSPVTNQQFGTCLGAITKHGVPE